MGFTVVSLCICEILLQMFRGAYFLGCVYINTFSVICMWNGDQNGLLLIDLLASYAVDVKIVMCHV